MKKIIILLCILAASSAFTQTRYIGKDHYRVPLEKFFNPGVRNEKGFLDLAKWLVTRDQTLWPNWVENTEKPNLPASLESNQMGITFINHSTFLIQIDGLTILTDPVFSERVSPVSWAGPKRVRDPGMFIHELPKIDVIVISHNHYDHLDIESLKKISKKFSPKIYMPMRAGKELREAGIKNIIELDWWASDYFGETIKITLAPAQHFSGRGLFDRNKSLWGSFVIRVNGYKIYFAGDTGYSNHFKEINERFGNMDFSLLPIGAYEPRWFMKQMHMNPSEAVRAHQDLMSRKSIGMHFGTFQLTDEGIYKPVEDLQRAKLKNKIAPNDFTVMSVGQTIIHNFGMSNIENFNKQ